MDQDDQKVGFRKVIKRRVDTRKHEESPVEKKSDDEKSETSDSSNEGKVVKPKKSISATKRLKRNPLTATVSIIISVSFYYSF
jgi:hypothetical protein